MRNYPVFAAFLILLSVRLFFYFQDAEVYKEDDQVRIEHTLRQEPKSSEYGQYFFVKNVMVSIPLYPTYEYGDTILINGSVESTGTDNRELLIVRDPDIVKLQGKATVFSFLSPIRRRVEESVLRSIPAKEGGLLLGILLGSRDKIGSDYYDELKNVGVLHVVAASGQNVAIVAGVIILVLSRVTTKKIAILLTVIGVVVYAALAGFDPPIVRASIMAMIAFGALLLGRQNSSLFALFVSAYLMLFAYPELILDVSFMLSFMSTFGIIAINPILGSILSFKALIIIKEDIFTTISAQLATFPILLNFFQSYSLLSIPVNLMVLFTIPVIMILGGIGAILSLINPILGAPFYFLAYPFLAYFGAVIGFFSEFSFELVTAQIPLTIVIGYYMVLLGLILKLASKQKNNA